MVKALRHNEIIILKNNKSAALTIVGKNCAFVVPAYFTASALLSKAKAASVLDSQVFSSPAFPCF